MESTQPSAWWQLSCEGEGVLQGELWRVSSERFSGSHSNSPLNQSSFHPAWEHSHPCGNPWADRGCSPAKADGTEPAWCLWKSPEFWSHQCSYLIFPCALLLISVMRRPIHPCLCDCPQLLSAHAPHPGCVPLLSLSVFVRTGPLPAAPPTPLSGWSLSYL